LVRGAPRPQREQAWRDKLGDPVSRPVAWYNNLCRSIGAFGVTPAMEAGITDHVREIAELLA